MLLNMSYSKMINASANVKHPDPRALPVLIFQDEYQKMMGQKVQNDGMVREELEVVL